MRLALSYSMMVLAALRQVLSSEQSQHVHLDGLVLLVARLLLLVHLQGGQLEHPALWKPRDVPDPVGDLAVALPPVVADRLAESLQKRRDTGTDGLWPSPVEVPATRLMQIPLTILHPQWLVEFIRENISTFDLPC